jgi:hypothetical protein
MARAAGPERGKTTMEKVEYRGWKNNLRLSNGDAELIATLDVGPRILSYRLADGKNVFKEFADQLGKSGESEWQIRGGHRLWAAPEDTTRTYAPDNGPVAIREIGPRTMRLTPAPETQYGLQKEMDVTLEDRGSRVTLVHRIRNVGSVPTDLAVWALSVMAPGGVEIIPLPPHAPHPGAAKNAKSAADFAPSFSMSVWPFTDFTDPRWHCGRSFVLLRQDAHRSATKLGLSHRTGWVGYLNDGTLFVKRFGHEAGRPYPDNGCNFETFTNEDMLEVESLGPLVRLDPGAAVEHTERWELIPGVGEVKTEADVEKNVVPRLGSR